MKLHEIMIGFIVVALLVSGITLFYSGGVQQYPVSDYDNSQFSAINDSMTDMIEISKETNRQLGNITADSSLTDVLGGFVVSAYGAVRSAGASLSLFGVGIDALLSAVNLGDYGDMVKLALNAIILIIMIAIFIHIITKSDRT